MRLITTLLLGPAFTTATAQCLFTPTITPDVAILCPGGSLELATQIYDAYQWYADGTLLAGQTGPTLFVNDAFGGQSITVEATLDGCTAESASVLVDGRVFLLPTIISGGDEYYAIDGNGRAYYCDGDTVLLVMGLPYSENIQWTNAGVDLSGATNDTLMVITAGAWSASGAPGVCPGWVQPVGVEVPTTFTETTQPQIVQVGDQLCPVPEGEAVQWYVNDAPLITTGPCIDVNVQGTYVVNVTYSTPCSVPSEPFLITTVKEEVTPTWSAYPIPANDHVFISGTGMKEGATWTIMDVTGRSVLGGSRSGKLPLRLDVSGLSPGRYWFTVSGERSLAIPVMH